MKAITEAMKIDWDALDFTEVRPHVSGATVGVAAADGDPLPLRLGRLMEGARTPRGPGHTRPRGRAHHLHLRRRDVEADTGDTLLIPGGTRHSAEVPGGRVVTLNIFPTREYRL